MKFKSPIGDMVKPDGWPPAAISKAILKQGGTSINGFPTFRLVQANQVLKMRGGEWQLFRGGKKGQSRGGLMVDSEGQRMQPTHEKPIKVTYETKWVPKYPQLDGGWVLEEWYPAKMIGTPEAWAAQKVPNRPDISVLAVYPSEGLYMMAFPMAPPQVPPMSMISRAIAFAEYSREFWASFSPAVRRQMWEDADLHAKTMHDQALRTRDMAIAREELGWIFSTSLEAGRIRTKLAERRGIRHHVGA